MKSISRFSAFRVILISFFVACSCNRSTQDLLESDNTALSAKLPGLNSSCAGDYEWGYFKIGGGGYVTGIAVHPGNAGIRYIRTDVGGAWRWDTANEKWEQMLEWVTPSNKNLIGVDGIALDPNNEDIVYLALGKSENQDGGVYRSANKGQTWSLLPGTSSFRFAGNGRQARWIGECIAVDPHNSDVIYVGTRTGGLYRSVDGGNSWDNVQDVPDGHIGTNPTGVRTIVFDPSALVDVDGQQRSKTVYVGIPGEGIYGSYNGGSNFYKENSPGIEYPARMQVIPSDQYEYGELFVTYNEGVMLKKPNWEWVEIMNHPQGQGNNFVALAVDANNSSNIVVAERYSSFDNSIYRSVDKGQNWELINRSNSNYQGNTPPWWPEAWFSSATASMALLPGSPGEIFYTDWFGVWNNKNIWSSNQWHANVDGLEETSNVALVAPPWNEWTSGALVYSGFADIAGFRHDALDEAPGKRLYNINEISDIAVCEQYAGNIAIIASTSWQGDNTSLKTSDDSGETWTDRDLPSGSKLGRIAIAANSVNKMVYINQNGSVYYTADRGNTWSASQGVPTGAVTMSDIWNKEFPLVADKVKPNTFYIVNKQDGILYASTDGGSNWVKKNESNPLPQISLSTWINVDTAPGIEGEVWVSLGSAGLWKISDGENQFTKIQPIDQAKLFSFGAPAAGSAEPAAYYYQETGGEGKLFRSVDMGLSWCQINPPDFQFLTGAKTLAADRNTYGRVYLGNGATGIIYGKP